MQGEGAGEERRLGLKSLSDPSEGSSVDIQLLSKNEIYVILICGYEIQMTIRPKKYINVCSDSQAALKALRLLKLRPHWYGRAKGHWVLFPLFGKTHVGFRTFW
jgi:hypothetical protein